MWFILKEARRLNDKSYGGVFNLHAISPRGQLLSDIEHVGIVEIKFSLFSF